MSRSLPLALVLFAAAVAAGPSPLAGEPEAEPAAAPAGQPEGVRLETLLKSQLEGVEGTEVIVSRVTIPPNTSLPKHWHPGEEFAYVLEGTVTLWQDGKEDMTGRAGDAMMIPLKQVHTARTGDEAATVLVFRVHERGEPERFPAE
jgi:quercetin dioxygenase-like cupin family protein